MEPSFSLQRQTRSVQFEVNALLVERMTDDKTGIITFADPCSTIPHRHPPHVLSTIFQDTPLPIRDRPRTFTIPLR